MSTKKRATGVRKSEGVRRNRLDPGLLAAHKAYEDAINSNDTDRVMACYDHGAAQMPPDAPQTVGWKQLRKAVADYFAAYKTHWKKVVQANWVSGEWGFDQGHDTAVDIPYDGGPTIHYDCKGILIYRRQANGEWKVFRDIWNNNKPPHEVPQDGRGAKSKGSGSSRAATTASAVKKAGGRKAASGTKKVSAPKKAATPKAKAPKAKAPKAKARRASA
ncbi:MAG: hypothetical protein IPK82_28605 [Polyangiaceae bacterium]|nr:hypothetical protein [Polyangiaceae bacterium]